MNFNEFLYCHLEEFELHILMWNWTGTGKQRNFVKGWEQWNAYS